MLLKWDKHAQIYFMAVLSFGPLAYASIRQTGTKKKTFFRAMPAHFTVLGRVYVLSQQNVLKIRLLDYHSA